MGSSRRENMTACTPTVALLGLGILSCIVLSHSFTVVPTSARHGVSPSVLFTAIPGPGLILKRTRMPSLLMSSSSGLSKGESQTEATYQVPENCRRLRIRKPLGVILEEVHDGKGAFVVQVNEGSNAEKAGVQVGELLVACSAATLKAGKEGAYANQGYGGRPFDNWEIVMFPCIDTPFKSIMQALASNNERWGIDSISVVLAPKKEEPQGKEE